MLCILSSRNREVRTFSANTVFQHPPQKIANVTRDTAKCYVNICFLMKYCPSVKATGVNKGHRNCAKAIYVLSAYVYPENGVRR